MTESALINCEWLQQNLVTSNLVILDATFFLPRQQRNARSEFELCHIPGARFFDIDLVADKDSTLPHTLPSADYFAAMVGALGIDNDSVVIVYDNNHFFAAARVWWMFRVFGHDRVKVLDGGLQHWRQLGYPLTDETPRPVGTTFNARFRPELVFDLEQMRSVQQNDEYQILDARSPDSFLGLRPLVDPEIQAGHIPDSINIPYAGLTDKRQTLLASEMLLSLFKTAQVDLSRPIVTSCGSGVSAAVLALALYQIGLINVPMYDGSWAEWGKQPDTPKKRG